MTLQKSLAFLGLGLGLVIISPSWADEVLLGLHDSNAQILKSKKFCVRFAHQPSDQRSCYLLERMKPTALLNSADTPALSSEGKEQIERFRHLWVQFFATQSILSFERMEEIPFSIQLTWEGTSTRVGNLELSGRKGVLFLFGTLHKAEGRTPVTVEIENFADASGADLLNRGFHFESQVNDPELEEKTQLFLNQAVAPLLAFQLNTYFGVTKQDLKVAPPR